MSLIHSVTVENHSVCCDFRKMGEELIAYTNNTFALSKGLTGPGELDCLKQGSQTRGPRAACGPPRVSLKKCKL